MRRAVDPDTADRMDESNVPITHFRAVESFIKKRESRLRSRGAAPSAGKGPDAMVYGMSAPEAPAPQPGPAATVPESPLPDPWAGVAADLCARYWVLDAFGKG